MRRRARSVPPPEPIRWRDLIRGHLTVKDDPYRSQTLLQRSVGEAVRKMAEDRLAAIVATWQPKVNAIVERTLGKPFQAAVFSELESALKRVCLADLRITATAEVRRED